MRQAMLKGLCLLGVLAGIGSASAEGVVQARLMSLELSRDIAQAAVEACREDGYQVSVVILDRSGVPQMVMRDVFAPPSTLDIATRKARATVLSRTASGEFRENRPELAPALNNLGDLLVLRGAMPITAAGQFIGAVGVSGAPGGDLDEACARNGLEAVQDRLSFAEF